jgi:2-desacetyl-2-hydroxyethyl bacteriochlorophyllide A dehydrogenase
MQAAFYKRNKTFEVGENRPVIPGPDEVRVEVAYCGVCGTDFHIYMGHMDKRVADPQIIGHEMSGVVAEVGENVSEWQSGDRVVVRPLDYCGDCPACRAGHQHICQNLKFLGIDTHGAMQGSWTVPAHTLHRLPESVSLQHAALIEPMAVACHDVRLGDVKAGEHVVVIGGGPIGMLIALVAREAGANVLISEVTGFRIELARELGFDVVNPMEDDLQAVVETRTGNAGADVVFEVSGSKAGAEVMTEIARTRGRIVLVAIFAQPTEVNLFRFFWRELQLIGTRVYEPEDFDRAIELVAGGSLPLERLISTTRPLTELQTVFEQIEGGADFMKAMIDIRA